MDFQWFSLHQTENPLFLEFDQKEKVRQSDRPTDSFLATDRRGRGRWGWRLRWNIARITRSVLGGCGNMGKGAIGFARDMGWVVAYQCPNQVN